jgi:hypothetical protein
VRVEEYLGGVRLMLVFDDLTAGLRVTRSYVCYPQAPAIETWSTFEAIDSTSGIPISDIGIWQLTVPIQVAHWVSGHGASVGAAFVKRQQVLGQDMPFEIGSTTRSSESAVPTSWFSGSQGNLFVGLLWSGEWTLSATAQTRRGMVTVRLSAGSTATTGREGESFETPHGVFGVAASRQIDVTAALQQYVTNGLRRGAPVRARPVDDPLDRRQAHLVAALLEHRRTCGRDTAVGLVRETDGRPDGRAAAGEVADRGLKCRPQPRRGAPPHLSVAFQPSTILC